MGKVLQLFEFPLQGAVALFSFLEASGEHAVASVLRRFPGG